MLAKLKAIFAGGKVAAVAAAALAIIAAAWKVMSNAEAVGAAKQKAKEDERYKEDVARAGDAVRARDDVLGGRVRPDDADPYRRD